MGQWGQNPRNQVRKRRRRWGERDVTLIFPLSMVYPGMGDFMHYPVMFIEPLGLRPRNFVSMATTILSCIRVFR